MMKTKLLSSDFICKTQMLRWLLCCLLFPFSLTHSASAQEVKASIDTTDIRYGEEIKYTIQVRLDSVQPVVFPEGQTFSPLETIEFYPIDTLAKKELYELRRTYGITGFDSGSYRLPKQFVLINDTPIETSSFDIRVHEVVVDTLAQPMYSIKPFIPVKRTAVAWKTIGIWVVALALLAFLIWYFFVKKKGILTLQKKALPPLEEAMQAFKALDTADYLQQNNSKEYYSKLTNIVKRYLDREVTADALESTTEQLLLRLEAFRHSGKIPFSRSLLRDLEAVLKRADLIKFANMSHEIHYVDSDRVFMETMVVETDKILPEVQEESEEEALAKQKQEEMQRKKKSKLLILGFASILLLLGLGYGVYHYTMKNVSTEWDDSEWISSAYGYPPLWIKTPEVLVRTDAYVFQVPGTEEVATFVSGEITDPLYIMVESLTKNPENPPAIEHILEQSIDQLERMGAVNLLVKTDGFQIEDQAQGIVAHGSFNLESSVKRAYELYLIDQASALYQVLIVYPDGDSEMEKTKEHIIDSIQFITSN